MPTYRKAATVSRSIPTPTEGVVGPRSSSNGQNCIMPALRRPLVATSLPKLFLQGNLTPRQPQTACWKLLQPTPIVRRTQQSKRPKKCTYGDMVTLMTTVHQIVTGLLTADTEDDRFAVIKRAVYVLVMRELGSQSSLSDRAV